MNASRYKIAAWQGATLRREFELTTDDEPDDLTGKTARMQVRPTAASETVALEVTDYIELGEGTITINVPASVMAEVPAGTYAYDLELVTPGEVEEVDKLIEGSFVVYAEVTRETEEPEEPVEDEGD